MVGFNWIRSTYLPTPYSSTEYSSPEDIEVVHTVPVCLADTGADGRPSGRSESGYFAMRRERIFDPVHSHSLDEVQDKIN